jgi:hypothetical protein
MRKSIVLVALSAMGLASGQSGLAQGCCAGGAMKSPCSTAGVATASNVANHATAKAVLPQAIRPVFEDYLSIQSALAQDSFERFQQAAVVLTKASHNAGNSLSSKVLQQVEALAKASDLASARALFKPVSESLIAYLKQQKFPNGVYRVAYCPMADASWLQRGDSINNPYMGKQMLRCGQFKG